MKFSRQILILAYLAQTIDGFVVKSKSNIIRIPVKRSNHDLIYLMADAVDTTEAADSVIESNTDSADKRRQAKSALLGLIGNNDKVANSNQEDPVLADPVTKEGLKIIPTGTVLGGQGSKSGRKVSLVASQNTYSGRTNTYFNLLRSQKPDESSEQEESETGENKAFTSAVSSLQVFIPPPLRPVLSMTGLLPGYIPMRDLFTSPSVSFAYERGWRQGFASAGFPGADKEYEMVKEFFSSIEPQTVVDMSCATGLFTRRLTKGNDYGRVIACDYSEAMLLEARNRIQADPELNNGSISTKLDLVRCDVGDIPMKSNSVDALHAGAAMHCWPDLDSAMSEIYRVLRPGGKYFASTFLAPYFRTVRAAAGDTNIEQQAFQFFETVEDLKDIVRKGGFEDVDVEVLGNACAIIRATKAGK